MKKFYQTSLVLFLGNILILSAANAAGLSHGNNLSTQLIEGALTVQCIAGGHPSPVGVTTYCNSQILNPSEYDSFVGPTVDADQVSVFAKWENGSVTKTKTLGYDGVNGKSKGEFNLWIRTLLQRPLLNLGKNTVTYALFKKGSTVETGTFEVNVADAGRAVCRRMGHYYSNNASDCNMPQNLCDQYFSDNNYCQ